MNITAPPLTPPPEPVNDPTTISNIPIAIIAKAMKNNHVAIENCEATGSLATDRLALARQSEQDHRAGSKQSLHTVRPQDWQT
jgi:hypothetical protein